MSKIQKQSITYNGVRSIQIYLNSANADLYLNSSMKSKVVFFFKDPLMIERNAIETKVGVIDAQFPVSWYLINSSNNSFSITQNSVTTPYNFPAGNYNANSFMTKWVSYMGSSWVITLNSLTNIFTISNSNGQFTITDGSNSFLPILGLLSGASYTSSGNYISSVFPINFSGLTRINICSSTILLKNVDSKNKSRNNVIAAVPCNSASNGIIFYNNYTNFKTGFKNHEISSLDIEIKDDFKNNIDFQNADWTMTIQIDILSETVQSLDTLDDVYFNLEQEL